MLQVIYSVKQLIVPASALLLATQQRQKCFTGFHWKEKKCVRLALSIVVVVNKLGAVAECEFS